MFSLTNMPSTSSVLSTYTSFVASAMLVWTKTSFDEDTASYATEASERKSIHLTFHKECKDKILSTYLPYVAERSKAIKETNKVVKLYSLGSLGRDYDGPWGSINFEHPSTFDTLAMDPVLRKELLDDLDRFVRRKEFYKRVGKAWKRGYLLYGPPGTGKSSLIASMANYLNIELENRTCGGYNPLEQSQLTLSGLLNFVDGLWSSCGDERVIVFSTNYKEKLDPALLRPGRMDMHIHMSYLTPSGFKVLAFNYLRIRSHSLFSEIEELLKEVEVTPAEVAEELVKSDDDADIALQGVIDFLQMKKELQSTNVEEAEAGQQENKRQKIEVENTEKKNRGKKNKTGPPKKGKGRP
ncbi:AAA-ATPase [Melia azedarach]|uniref:AAA-ATPase n=1 Tax=Melia azedarach TaxID=155640 RepID=A0ACC1XJ03_MELAZ|nr:AAA-ATPase [Melia azedarach]